MLGRISARLVPLFLGVFSAETVQRFVIESHRALAETARVRDHLPNLAEKLAEERLTALAQADGLIAKQVYEILFVCTRNAGRSQLAAALMDHYAAGRVHVRTAGTRPASEIEPAVEIVLAERGLEIAREFPKPLTDEVVRAADVVVSMGCGDACPVYPGRRYLEWTLPEIRETTIAVVMDLMVRDLLDELVPSPA
ncbi:arsenate-mycothiol transferase ArsC [Herbidospora mongoliensis]|uniref:arsenate-mycothiol transferase ArsC n=1 Tax=Herbidospora mongoliensis TaxID=688067 RepID=UPI001FE0988C|nr:arsenate reductase ArsC [Herbidospora mongoliensis]